MIPLNFAADYREAMNGFEAEVSLAVNGQWIATLPVSDNALLGAINDEEIIYNTLSEAIERALR